MSFPLALKVKEDSENALLQQVEDAAGKRLWRVRLDRFQGMMGISFDAGPDRQPLVTPLSEAYVSESYVDEYLVELARIMKPLVDVVGAEVAWNLVLSERNGHRQRDRMEAAKKVSALAPAYAKIHGILKELRYNWKHDGYDFRDIWVVKGKIVQPQRDELQNVVCALHIEHGGVHMGHGDGYHRGFDERSFATVKRVTVPIMQKAIAKETARVLREQKEWENE